MERIKLDFRLAKIAELVEKGASVVDVGTDHGYLPIWLMQNGAAAVIACDINSAPLKTAMENAVKFFQPDISFKLCDGLYGISAKAVDTVIIAGMGGETIWGIIERSGWDWSGKRLILQPMSKQPELIHKLYENGFSIVAESIAEERDELYRIIVVEHIAAAKPREAFIHCGFSNGKYYRTQRDKLIRALNGLRQAKQLDYTRIAEYTRILEDINDAYR